MDYNYARAKTGPEDVGGMDLGVEGGDGGSADSTCRESMKSQSSCWVLFMGKKLEAAERDGRAQHLRYIYW